MAYKCKRSIHAIVTFSVLNVKSVSSANKRLCLVPVSIKTVDRDFLLLPIDCYSLV